jgi:N-acetylglucosamine-6-phosphate deacetylase
MHSSQLKKAFSASQIFDGKQWLQDHSVIVENGLVVQLVKSDDIANDIPVMLLENQFLLPAFIDVQVYGATGKLFSVERDEHTLQLMSKKFSAEGTVLFQPTIATNTYEVIRECIDAVRTYKNNGGHGVHGFHIEGPWINESKRGAHIAEWIHVPSIQQVSDLLEYGKDCISMITLAPEVCNKEIIDLIESYGVLVSAGHSDSDFITAMKSFDNGITAITHLYNAMSGLHHRQPGLTGAAFLHEKVCASIIPDGHHVDYEAIKIAKQIMGERLFAITDAVTDTYSGPYRHEKNGDKFECNGTLSGSALSMYQAFYNLVHYVGIEKGEAHRMCSLYPARVLGIEKRYGRIAPGFTAQFLVMNKQLKLVDVII